ncbi:MAG: membrane protein insertase YidC [Pirellulaceae bacterium]|nr:membrane protein insertase YidC [Pirellulaceae bacterium]
MERRLLSFIIASTAFFFFYISMRVMFAPPVPPANVAQNVAGDDGANPGIVEAPDADAVADNQGSSTVGGDKADQNPTDPSDDNASQDDSNEDDALPDVQRPEHPDWVTLGSMDPASNHLMMVTLNSRGGGIERIELTTRGEDGGFKYRRVDVRNGYLGYFAGEPSPTDTGVLVNVVGPGTPAATAKATSGGANGIQVGDVMISVNTKDITTLADIDEALRETKPGDEVKIEVLRRTRPDAETEPTTVALTAKLSEHPLDLVRLAKYGGEDQVDGNLSRLSCLMTLAQVNRKSIATNEFHIDGLSDPADLIWNVTTAKDNTQSTAIFDLEMSAKEMAEVGGQPVRITRTYSLSPSSYVLDMMVEVENLGDQPQKLAYRLEGVNGVTMEGWWYSNKITPSFSRAAARDIVYKTTAEGHEVITGCNLLKEHRKEPKDPHHGIFAEDDTVEARDLNYIGVDAQYFNCSYLPPDSQLSMRDFRRASAMIVADESEIRKYQEHAVNTSFYLDSVIGDVPVGGKLQSRLRLFAGPKETDLVARYGLDDTIYYGWFAPFAKILVSVLHFLHSIVGNYAVAIILLTVMVRGLMFPLSRKAAVNAQRMQELAPELKKIAEQYKDDMEGRLKAQRELQRRVGFNPMAGCLPMFLQLPIFIGLYRALSVDIELRQSAVSQSTLWASNLAGPDMFGRWDGWLMEYFSGRGTGWLGPYFNILPVLVVALFLTQQKLFMPPATDEQTAMTQKVMGVMTLFMGLFFFRVPAGLCLYFIASSLWGICERVLVKKTLPKSKHFDQGVIDGTATVTAKQPKTSLATKIREQMGQKEEAVVTPNKRKRPPGGRKNRPQ